MQLGDYANVATIVGTLIVVGGLVLARYRWLRARRARVEAPDRAGLATPSAVSALPVIRAATFRGRANELATLTGLINSGKLVIWVTGAGQSGKSWLMARCIQNHDLVARAARFEMKSGYNLDGLLEGLNGFLCAKGENGFDAACRNPSVPATGKIGPLLHVLNRGKWVLVLDSYERLGDDNEIHALVQEAQKSLTRSLILVGSRVTPGWADPHADVHVAAIERTVGLDILKDAGAPPDSLDALYTAVGGLPGALEIAGALARERGAAAIAKDLKGTTGEIGERLFGETFDAASDGAKRLWAGLCLLPAPVTPDTAETICHRDDFHPAWSELVRWKVLDPGEERAELHPLARAVGAARLKGMRAWAKACAERTSAHYAGFAEKNANQPLLVDAELENILAAAYLAFHHEQWEPLWAIGYALDAPLNYAGRWHAREQLLRLCSEGAKSSGSKRQHAAFSHNYAFALQQRGALDEAERLYRESLGIEREVGDKPGVAKSLHQLGMVAQLRGDPAEAERLYRESLMIEREVGDRPGEGESLHQLGMVAQDRGGLGEAERLYRESLAIAQEVGDRRGEATSLAQLGLLAEAQGDLSLAVERTQQAATIFDAMRLPEKEEAKAQLKRLRRRLGEERE